METVYQYVCVNKQTGQGFVYRYCKLCAYVAQFNTTLYNVTKILCDGRCMGCMNGHVRNLASGKLTQSVQ